MELLYKNFLTEIKNLNIEEYNKNLLKLKNLINHEICNNCEKIFIKKYEGKNKELIKLYKTLKLINCIETEYCNFKYQSYEIFIDNIFILKIIFEENICCQKKCVKYFIDDVEIYYYNYDGYYDKFIYSEEFKNTYKKMKFEQTTIKEFLYFIGKITNTEELFLILNDETSEISKSK
jgi:hypothetical protein